MLDAIVWIDGAAIALVTALFFVNVFRHFAWEARAAMEQGRAPDPADLHAAFCSRLQIHIATPEERHWSDVVLKQRVDAADKAMMMLADWLTPMQRRQMAKYDAFVVYGSHGKIYIVEQRINFGVVVLDAFKRPVQRLCFEPVGASHMGDKMLAQKIALELNEREVWTYANKTVYVHADCDPTPSYHDLTSA